MMPKTNQHVKCMFKNNVLLEGTVEEWYGNMIQLRSMDGKNVIVIPDPIEIMFYIIVESEPEENSIEPPTELEEQFQQVYEQPSDDPLRTKSLAELKGLMAEQEKQIIIDKLRSHHIGDVRKVEYGYPGFYKKPGA
jgi:hypothetical protein